MKSQCRGFNLMEMMAVVAIIAILSMTAIPSLQDKFVRDQVVEGMQLADIVKTPIARSWSLGQVLPPDNASAGLPPPEKIVNNYVRAITVDQGAIHIVYGNRVNGFIKDKIISIRPAIVEDAKMVPVTWVCGYAAAPEQMTAQGENRTNVAEKYLPMSCRKR